MNKLFRRIGRAGQTASRRRSNLCQHVYFPSSVVLALGIISPLFGQVDSTWIAAGNGSWLEAQNWNGPIPNSPGDIARLQRIPPGDVSVDFSSQITLGELQFTDSANFALIGTGTLQFENSNGNPSLTAVSRRALHHNIGVPIGVAQGQQLNVNISELSSVSLLNGITPGGGELVLQGLGTLELVGASSSWDGVLNIQNGLVVAHDADSLGSTAGHTSVGMGGRLILRPRLTVEEDLRLLGGELLATGPVGTTALNGSIELVESSKISAGSTLLLNGQISGPAGVTYGLGGTSSIFVFGDNTYQGPTVVARGVIVEHENALGTKDIGTQVLESGTLTISARSAEPIDLLGGEVRFSSDADYSGAILFKSGRLTLPTEGHLDAPVQLDATSGQATIWGRGSTFAGGTTGVGDLVFYSEGQGSGLLIVQQESLSHDGGVEIRGGGSVVFNTANTYSGDTAVHGNGRLFVNHEQALGTSSSPVDVAGTLVLNEAVDRELQVTGTLQVDNPQVSVSRTIRLGDSSSSFTSGSIRGVGRFPGTIEFAQSDNFRAFIGGGIFEGNITGSAAEINIGGTDPVFLNSDSNYRGITHSGGEAPVEVNASRALGDPEQGTRIGYGQFDINVATDEPFVVTSRGRINLNVQQDRLPRFGQLETVIPRRLATIAINTPSIYAEKVDVLEGVLEINAETEIDQIVVRKGGVVQIEDGVSLEINSGELVLQQGSVNGRMEGPELVLRKTTAGRAELGDMPGFRGDIVVEKGVLQTYSAEAFGTGQGTVQVAQQNAVLMLSADGSKPPVVIKNDIFLDNATGIDHAGGLFVNRIGSGGDPTIRLEGRLDLGNLGSIVGSVAGTSFSNRVNLELAGPITGGSLTTRGGHRVKILNGANSYAGETRIQQSSIELAGDGRLMSTSKIVLVEGPESYNGTLSLNNREISLQDRLADSIPIDFRGGELDATEGTSETIGQFNFIEGDSAVELSSGARSSELHVTAITRQAGATARLDARNGELNVAESPKLSGGILPWLVVRDSFTANSNDTFGIVVEGRVRGMSTDAFVSGFASAEETDNVVVHQSGLSLANDTTVNSLTFGVSHAPIDLGGNQLRVTSGGVIVGNGGRIENGTLVPGGVGENELIVHGRGTIEADITDNTEGPVSVTYTPTISSLFINGNNTYTGTTYFNDGVTYLGKDTALPDNADLVISGGEVQIGYVATEAKHLGHVRIGGFGEFTVKSGQGIFSFDEIVLEDGTLRPGQLVGSGDIIKRTIGAASIGADQRSTFNGRVVVEEGRLLSDGLSEASYVVRGGSLYLQRGDNPIELDGGTLYISDPLGGNITVSSSSTISTEDRSSSRFNPRLAGALSGTGDLTITSETPYDDRHHSLSFLGRSPHYSGHVTIDSVFVGANAQDSLGTGDITILPGGRLSFGGNIDSQLPSFDFSNNIYLQGGELFGRDDDRQPRQLLGELHVSGHSVVGEMNVLGATHLADGTRLTTFREGILRFIGDIKIGGYAEIEYGLQEIVTNSAGTDGGVVQLLGTIFSDAEQSILNLLDRGLDELVLDASYHVADGHTFQVLKDGLPIELELSGAQNRVSGGGTLLNPIDFRDGATISPGSSPGILYLESSTTLGGDSVYEWEINDAEGTAGQAYGWDLFSVFDELVFEATQESPFVLSIKSLDLSGQSGLVHNFDSNQEYEWLIAMADSLRGFKMHSIRLDLSDFINGNPRQNARRFSVRSDRDKLFLVYQIPEPSTIVCMIIAISVFSLRFRIMAFAGNHR